MKEITKTIYRAKDGKEFLTKEECRKHESFLNNTEEVKKAYDSIIKYCTNNCNEDTAYNEPICTNSECPFYQVDVYEYNCIFRCYPYQDMPDVSDLNSPK